MVWYVPLKSVVHKYDSMLASSDPWLLVFTSGHISCLPYYNPRLLCVSDKRWHVCWSPTSNIRLEKTWWLCLLLDPMVCLPPSTPFLYSYHLIQRRPDDISGSPWETSWCWRTEVLQWRTKAMPTALGGNHHMDTDPLETQVPSLEQDTLNLTTYLNISQVSIPQELWEVDSICFLKLSI